MLYFVAALIGFAAGLVGLRFILEPASALRLGIFRPWRGDAWPQGVQEAEGVRFRLNARRPATPAVPTWSDIVIRPDASADVPATTPADPVMEDLSTQGVEVRPVRSVEVHRSTH